MTDTDWLRLDAQLCFRLYAASRTVTRCYQPLLGALDLTYPQYLVMLVLWEGDDLTVKAIGERLMLDSGTLTPLLKRMAESDLISRHRRPENEREVRICLTKSGRALREQAVDVPPALVSALGMPVEEIVQLRDLLDKLLKANEPPEIE